MAFFGTWNPIIEVKENSKVRKKVICPSCKLHFESLERHMTEGGKHWCATLPKHVAKFYQSLCIRMYSFITTVNKHAVRKPTACLTHHVVVNDIKQHLHEKHGLEGDELVKESTRLRRSVDNVYRQLSCVALPKYNEASWTSTSTSKASKYNEGTEDEEDDDIHERKENGAIFAINRLHKTFLKTSGRSDTPKKMYKEKHCNILTEALKRANHLENQCFTSFKDTTEDLFRLQKILARTNQRRQQNNMHNKLERFGKQSMKKWQWPSELRNTNALEDKWFQPLYKKLETNSDWPKSKQVPCLTAVSMQSYLGSLKQLCTYSLNRNIDIGLKMSDITWLDIKFKELTNRVQVFKDDRKA